MNLSPTLQLWVGLFSGLLYYLFGVAYYSTTEGWDVTDSIYFITVSFSTVGYGQIVPTTDNARVFTSFYILWGIYGLFSFAKATSKLLLVPLQKRVLDGIYGQHRWTSRARIGCSVTCIVVIFFIGLLSYAVLENWTGAQSLYWTVQTMTTVGYGDLDVKYQATRRFGIFFILLCVLTFALAVDNFESAKLLVQEDEVGLVNSNSSSRDIIPPSSDNNINNNDESEAVLNFCIKKGMLSATDADSAREYIRRQGPGAGAVPALRSNFDDSVTEVSGGSGVGGRV